MHVRVIDKSKQKNLASLFTKENLCVLRVFYEALDVGHKGHRISELTGELIFFNNV